jgi:hypothetical protein
MIIKRDSSIWQLATRWGDKNLPSNFCNLTWSCIWTFMLISVTAGLGSTAAGKLLGELVAWAVTGVFIGTPTLAVATVLFLFISALILIVLLMVVLTSKSTATTVRKVSNSYIGTAYKSWKHKYCPTIEEK